VLQPLPLANHPREHSGGENTEMLATILAKPARRLAGEIDEDGALEFELKVGSTLNIHGTFLLDYEGTAAWPALFGKTKWSYSVPRCDSEWA